MGVTTKILVYLPFILMVLGVILHLLGFVTDQWSELSDDVSKYRSVQNGLWKICIRRYNETGLKCATIPKELLTGL